MSILYPVSIVEKPDAVLSDTSENSIQNKAVDAAIKTLYTLISEKQDAPTSFTGTILAGDTELEFVNEVFAKDVIITSILTDNEETMILGVDQDTVNKKITITIDPMAVDVTVVMSIMINE